MRVKFLLFTLLLALTFYSCGGSGGGSAPSGSTTGFNYNNAPVKIAFDPGNGAIPLPNDANSTLLAGDNNTVKLQIDPKAPADTQALYTAINALKLKGLPSNTFVTLPLNTETKLDITSLYSNIMIVPFKTNVVSKSAIPPLSGPYNLIIQQDGKMINIIFKTRLLSNAQYVVIITKGVKTAAGDLVGRDATMELLLTQQYGDLIKAFGLKTDDILAMTTFTTADKTLKLSAFSKLAKGIQFDSSDMLSYDNITDELKSILAVAGAVPSVVQADTPASYAGLNYLKTSFTTYDITSLSSAPKTENAPVIILPKGITNKVVIFQHGLGGDKNNAFAIAQKFLAAGYPVISMDLPFHGERVAYDNTSFDCNKDGQVQSGECFLTANLVQDRINFYQAVFDLTMLLKDLKAGKFDINGDNVTDNITEVYFVGISLGSMTGSIFVNYNIDNLKKIALLVGGADLTTVLDGTKITDLQNAIAALGLTKGTGEYYTFLGMMHLILDPADPLYHVTPAIKDKTIVMTAYGDTIVPNASNAIMSSLAGFSSFTEITPNNIDNVSAVSGWYQYGATVDGSPYYVPHAFLLSTDNASASYGINFDQTFIDNAKTAVQNQIINFFNK
jgi:pimeloyl-ACP methyl ester carboxylesterase